MAESFKDKFAKILMDSKLIKKAELERALIIQKEKGGNLGKILIDNGYVTQKDLMIVLSQEFNIPPINLSKYNIDPSLILQIPERFARHYMVVPVSRIGNHMTVAVSDPMNIFAVDDVKAMTKCEIDLVISTESDIRNAIEICYGASDKDETVELETEENIEGLEVVAEEKVDLKQVTVESKQTSIVKVVDLILAEAIKKRASDIHIEPEEDALRIRYRVDGKLQEAFILPKKNQNAVLARLKIMSRLDITESRLPQDGRFKIRHGAKEIDFRVSSLPISFGSKMVLRALDKANLSVGPDKLGFLKETLDVFKKALERPYGMILVTGPTGSGKSTTLYSIITQLNVPERSIITVEDPVEYQVEGITQIQTNADIGLTFASGLRSLLRQSPDIIMIGEIRDFETADIAIKASLTGVLVLSTLHTNDAASAITRLIDMGVEPFLIASSGVMMAAQRLCRKICVHCKEPVDIPDEVLERAGIDIKNLRKTKKSIQFYKGKGCDKCIHTGYFGRLGTLETLLIDDKIREMIVARKSSDEINAYALKNGMKSLKANAIEKFVAGLTTLEEVLRITSD
ncbi:MAG: Flp pilus assembly complex ATPase component TadA [Candidatus Omnitrophica bacterium]|nr:Flp pilus assembly complex ATPase component TadA [Candidatus Omnitrophota bacterium]